MPANNDRYFEFMYREICVAINRRLSRYEIWLDVAESVGDPRLLSAEQVSDFIDQRLPRILESERRRLTSRATHRLRQRLLTFDPRHPTPEEWLIGLDANAA